MTYKPLGDVCGAVRWLASECVLNKTAATCEWGELLEGMPESAFLNEFNEAQVDHFRQRFENPELRAMMTGKAADGVELVNPGFWPTYEQESDAGNLSGIANPEENPWA